MFIFEWVKSQIRCYCKLWNHASGSMKLFWTSIMHTKIVCMTSDSDNTIKIFQCDKQGICLYVHIQEEEKTSNFCMKNIIWVTYILKSYLETGVPVQRAIQLASQLRILASHFHHFKPKFLSVLKPIILCTFWGIFLKQKFMSQFVHKLSKDLQNLIKRRIPINTIN